MDCTLLRLLPAVQSQLHQMLRWAAELAPTPADSAESWELLAAMVTGRKEVMRDAAGETCPTEITKVTVD